MSDALPLGRVAPPDLLTRNRRIATGVLLAMAAVYGATYLLGHPGAPVLFLRAMAEAGMIGGLADWFAVTALFRHPLGIPIPHTALLPKNQSRAARNVGRFFETHFLAPDQIEARLRAIESSRHIAGWLGRRENARMLARQLAPLVAILASHAPSPRGQARGRAWLRRQALQVGSDAAIAEEVASLAKAGIRGGVTGDVIGLVRGAIDENRDLAIALVQENSRWWIASTVDRRLADMVVNAVLALLDDLGREDAPLRLKFETAFDEIVDALGRDGAIARAVAGARHGLVASGALDAASAALLSGIRARLAADPDALVEPLADLIGEVAARLLAEPGSQSTIDAGLAGLAGQFIAEARPQIAGYIGDVIAGWEPAELNARFEAEIGPDLQFIRINGAILGSVIGGVLFGVEALLG